MWLSRTDVDTLGDLLDSMVQYRPSARPSAKEVLAHPFFQHRPVPVEVPGPPLTDGRWELYLEYMTEAQAWGDPATRVIGTWY